MTLIRSIRDKKTRINHEKLLSFNGIDQYIDLGIFEPLNYSGSFAISFMVNFSQVHPEGNVLGALFMKEKPVGNSPIKIAYFYQSNLLAFVIGTNNGLFQPINVFLNGDTLTHCVCSWNQDTGSMKIYLNGVLSRELTTPPGTTLNNDGTEITRIGSSTEASGAIKTHSGSLGNLIIFNRELTVNEVISLHALGGVVPRNLHDAILSHWPFSEPAAFIPNIVCNPGFDRGGNCGFEGAGTRATTLYVNNFSRNATKDYSSSPIVEVDFLLLGDSSQLFQDVNFELLDFNDTVLLVIPAIQPADGSDLYQTVKLNETIGAAKIRINYSGSSPTGDASILKIVEKSSYGQRVQAVEEDIYILDVIEQYNYSKEFLRKGAFEIGSLGDLTQNGGGSYGSITYENGDCILEQTSGIMNQNHGIQGANITLEEGKLYRFRVGYNCDPLNSDPLRIQVLNYSISQDFGPGESGIFEANLVGGTNQAFAIVGNGAVNPSIGDVYRISFFEFYEVGKQPQNTNHGKSIGFLPEQLGINENPTLSSISSLSKNQAFSYGISNAFNDRIRGNGNRDIYYFSNQNSFGDNVTGILPSGSNFTIAFIGSYPSNRTYSFSGDGQTIFGRNIELLLSLRGPDFFRMRFNGEATNARDFNVPSFGISRNQNRTFIVIVRFDNVSLELDYYFKFLDSEEVLTQTVTSPTNWARANNTFFNLSFINLNGSKWVVSSQKQSDSVIDEMLNLKFDEVTEKIIDATTNKQISSSVYDTGTGNLNYQLRTIDTSPAPLDEELILGNESGLPLMDSALFVNSNTKRIQIPASDLFNPGNENGYTFIFGYALDEDRDFDLDYFFSNRSAPSVILSSGGAPRQIFSQHPITSTTSFDLKNQNLNYINCTAITISPNTGDQNTSVYHNGVRIGQYGGGGNILDLSVNDQDARFFWDVVGSLNGYLICAGVWSRVMSTKEIASFYNNSLFNQTVLDNTTEVYFQFNKGSFFEDGTNVRIKDLSNKNKTITYTGWSGGTTTEQLTDLLNNVQSLDSIR